MSDDEKPIADRIRTKIAEIGPQEALRRLRLALEPTEDEIMADLEAMTDEEIDAELGLEYNIDTIVDELRAQEDFNAWCNRMVAEITAKIKARG